MLESGTAFKRFKACSVRSCHKKVPEIETYNGCQNYLEPNWQLLSERNDIIFYHTKND